MMNDLSKCQAVTKDDLTIVYYCHEDKRYYCANAERPLQWNYSSPDYSSAVQHMEFVRKFWDEKVALADGPRKLDVVRVNGTHYLIGDENADPRGFRGFGGTRFYIRFNDGRLVQSTNLWCQGEIPKAYRDRLPDNAAFLREEQWREWMNAPASS